MTSKESEIRKTIIIDAPPEVVFNAITNESELVNWFPDIAILEPRVGGKVRFTFHKEKSMKDKDHHLDGTILEYVKNEKISYTWHFEEIPEMPRTVVTWTVEKIDGNKTKIELLHTGFDPSARETFDEHNKGWTYFTVKLAEYCASKKNN